MVGMFFSTVIIGIYFFVQMNMARQPSMPPIGIFYEAVFLLFVVFMAAMKLTLNLQKKWIASNPHYAVLYLEKITTLCKTRYIELLSIDEEVIGETQHALSADRKVLVSAGKHKLELAKCRKTNILYGPLREEYREEVIFYFENGMTYQIMFDEKENKFTMVNRESKVS